MDVKNTANFVVSFDEIRICQILKICWSYSVCYIIKDLNWFLEIDLFENCHDTLPDDYIGPNCTLWDYIQNVYNSSISACTKLEAGGYCNSLLSSYGCGGELNGTVKDYCQKSCRFYGVDCTGIFFLFIHSKIFSWFHWLYPVIIKFA